MYNIFSLHNCHGSLEFNSFIHSLTSTLILTMHIYTPITHALIRSSFSYSLSVAICTLPCLPLSGHTLTHSQTFTDLHIFPMHSFIHPYLHIYKARDGKQPYVTCDFISYISFVLLLSNTIWGRETGHSSDISIKIQICGGTFRQGG